MENRKSLYRKIIIPICIIIILCSRFIPSNKLLTSEMMGVIGIFVGSLILWLSVGIDWPSLLTIFAIGLLPSIGFNNALTSSFGNSTFIFLLFTFIITYALSKTNLFRRVAIVFISNKFSKKNGYIFTFSFLLAVLFLGLFISPSVLFVIMLPILEEIFALTNINKEDKIAKMLMIGLGFSVSISSGMTTISHVFPILALKAANIEVNVFEYMLIGIPTGLIIFILMYFILKIIIRPDVSKLNNLKESNVIEKLKSTTPKANKKEKITTIVFIIVLLLWIIPSLIKDLLPNIYNYINGLGTAMPPILGAIALFIIRIDNKPILSVNEGFKNVPWGSLIMCAGTLALSSALTNNSIGLRTLLENSLTNSLNNLPSLTLLFIFILWAAIQTNLSSNMVTATLVSGVAATIINNTNSLNLSAVSLLIGFMASLAFATPPSMPHIAIICGSEYCKTKDVFINGVILMILSVIVLVFIGYPLANLILN